MTTETDQRIEQTFYTPAFHDETAELAAVPDYVKRSKHFQNLFGKVIRPFAVDSSQRIKFFTDGDPPYSPMDALPGVERIRLPNGQKESMDAFDNRRYPIKRAFEAQVQAIMASYMGDYIQPDGEIDPDYRTEWYNYDNIAPELVRILTTPEHNIALVHEAHAANIVAAAFEIVRNPDTQITIRTGFGGSEDPFTSKRLPAYTRSATSIAETIIDLYQDRESEKTARAAVAKVRATYAELSDNSELTPQEKRALGKEIDHRVRAQIQKMGSNVFLTEEERQEVQAKYAIAQNPVKLQFFYAHNAAIAINGKNQTDDSPEYEGMDPEKVIVRASENREAVANHIQQYHPRLTSVTEYIADQPWDQHTPYVATSLKYFAHILRESDDPDIQKVLAELKKLGSKRGGETGEELAALYAAMHPAAFGDQYPLPYIPYLSGEQANPTINITIGGRTEREFCAVREYITQNASAPDFLSFIETSRNEATDPETIALFSDAYRYVQTIQSQAEINQQPISHPPMHVIPLITDVGYHATYYANEFDRPNFIPDWWYSSYLQSEEQRLQADMAAAATDGEREEVAQQIRKFEGVVFDVNQLRKDQAKALAYE